MSERPKEIGCKPIGTAYAGSNPAPPTSPRKPVEPAHLLADLGTFSTVRAGDVPGRRHEVFGCAAGVARGSGGGDGVRRERAGGFSYWRGSCAVGRSSSCAAG